MGACLQWLHANHMLCSRVTGSRRRPQYTSVQARKTTIGVYAGTSRRCSLAQSSTKSEDKGLTCVRCWRNSTVPSVGDSQPPASDRGTTAIFTISSSSCKIVNMQRALVATHPEAVHSIDISGRMVDSRLARASTGKRSDS